MKFKLAYCAAAALLASAQLAAAQGPAGSTGAIASIPGNIVRAEPGQPVPQQGILGILTTPPGTNADWRQSRPVVATECLRSKSAIRTIRLASRHNMSPPSRLSLRASGEQRETCQYRSAEHIVEIAWLRDFL
jgi:hypothetical protein